MTLQMPGTGTSSIEVTHISIQGIWLYVKGKEYFLPFHWPKLDVDLSLSCLDHPEQYPLMYQ